jgi:predicted neuraminidase
LAFFVELSQLWRAYRDGLASRESRFLGMPINDETRCLSLALVAQVSTAAKLLWKADAAGRTSKTQMEQREARDADTSSSSSPLSHAEVPAMSLIPGTLFNR